MGESIQAGEQQVQKSWGKNSRKLGLGGQQGTDWQGIFLGSEGGGVGGGE